MPKVAPPTPSTQASIPQPRKTSRRLQPVWVVLLLAGLCLVFFHTFLLTGRTNFHHSQDTVNSVSFFARFMSESLHEGHVPEWNPHIFSGQPFVGDNMAFTYSPPFRLAAFFGPITFKSLQWVVILNYLLAGVGMYVFARSLSLCTSAALIAAVLFMFNGTSLSMLAHINILVVYSWLPLIFWGFHRAVRTGRVGWVMLTGVFSAFSLLSGVHPQVTWYIFFVLGLFAVFLALTTYAQSRRGLDLARPFLIYAGVIIVTLGLSAAQLLPMREFASFSTRSGPLPYVAKVGNSASTSGSLMFTDLMTLFIPNFYGLVTGPYWGSAFAIDHWLYLGLMALALVLVSLMVRNRWVAFFWGVLVVSFLIACGPNSPLNLHYLLYRFAPGADLFQRPSGIILLFHFSAPLLAGFGWQWVSAPETWRHRRRFLPLACGLVLGMGLVFYGVNKSIYGPVIQQFHQTEHVESLPRSALIKQLSSQYADSILVRPAHINRLSEHAEEAKTNWRWGLVGLLVVGLLSVALAVWVARGRLLIPAAIGLIIAVVFLDLFVFQPRSLMFRGSNGLYDPHPFARGHPVTEYLRYRKNPALWKVVAHDGDLAAPEVTLYKDLTDGAEIWSWAHHAAYMKPLKSRMGIVPALKSSKNPLSSIIDESMATGAGGSPASTGDFVIHLPRPQRVAEMIVLGSAGGRPTDLRLQYSSDGVRWETASPVRMAHEPSIAKVTVAYSPFETTYLRVTIRKAAAGGWWGALDLSIFGPMGERSRLTPPLARVRDDEWWLGAEGGMTYRLFATNGYKSLKLGRYDALNPLLARLPHLEDLLNVRYVLSAKPPTPPRRLALQYRMYLIHENPAAMPRAFWVPYAKVVPGPKQALDEVVSPEFPYTQYVVLEEPLPEGWAHTRWAGGKASSPGPSGGSVRFRSFLPDEITLGVDAPSDGFVFMSEAYFPGWRAEVDGVATKVYLANYAFRAIPVRGGKHTLRLTFRSSPHRQGRIISLLSLLVVCGVAILSGVRALKMS